MTMLTRSETDRLIARLNSIHYSAGKPTDPTCGDDDRTMCVTCTDGVSTEELTALLSNVIDDIVRERGYEWKRNFMKQMRTWMEA